MNPVLIAAVVILVGCSAFFSSSEIAYNSASIHKMRAKAETGDKRAIRAQKVKENYAETLSAILVGNNIVNIAATAVITVLAVDIVGPVGQRYAELITTILLLICGEVVPKILGVEHCNMLVLVYSAPLRFFVIIFRPIVWVVAKLVKLISPLWTPKEAAPGLTDEEMVMVVESIQDEGVITESESELIKSAIEFADITAHEIMIPRVDVVAVDVDSTIDQLLAKEEISHYTRIPVYEENIDHIVGIINIKQVLKLAMDSEQRGQINLRSLMKEPKYIHMTKSISDLLRELREEERNMAIILDGYGGTMGIVTVEDILEELVGDIFDETDEVELDYTEMSENEFQMDGDMNIYDVFELIDYEPRKFDSEYNTLGGWITEMLDRFPEEGDSFTYERLTVTVLSVEEHRVDQALIVLNPEEEE